MNVFAECRKFSPLGRTPGSQIVACANIAKTKNDKVPSYMVTSIDRSSVINGPLKES